MDSNEFKAKWRSFAVGSGLATLAFVFVGSVLDKNPVMTLLVGLLGFGVANAAFFLANQVDPPSEPPVR